MIFPDHTQSLFLTYNDIGTIVVQVPSHIFNSFDFDSYIHLLFQFLIIDFSTVIGVSGYKPFIAITAAFSKVMSSIDYGNFAVSSF